MAGSGQMCGPGPKLLMRGQGRATGDVPTADPAGTNGASAPEGVTMVRHLTLAVVTAAMFVAATTAARADTAPTSSTGTTTTTHGNGPTGDDGPGLGGGY